MFCSTQHVMADTLGSVGVIISTLLINRYGWTGFDPIASIFIAVLIFASVVPLVMDSASLLTLDLGSDRERDVRSALSKVSRHLASAPSKAALTGLLDTTAALGRRRALLLCGSPLLAKGPQHGRRVHPYPTGSFAFTRHALAAPPALAPQQQPANTLCECRKGRQARRDGAQRRHSRSD